MADRKDPTEITPKEPEYDIDKVDNRIVNYTKQIREKMHLEDVTESMARVAELAGLIATESKDTAEYIKEFMDDVQIEWNANPNKDPEIISARGGAAQLKDRFENTDRQLAHKVDKNATDLSINMFNENDRNVLQGQTEGTINAVLGAGNVEPFNLSSELKSILYINLFNSSNKVENRTISGGDGTLSPATGFFVTEPILVEPGDTVYANYTTRKALYDENNVAYKIELGTSSITATKKGHFRQAFQNGSESTIMIMKSPIPDEYVPYGLPIIKAERAYKLNKMIEDVNNIKELGFTDQWAGKKWVSYGDSTVAANNWQPQVASKLGLTHILRGIGGTTVAKSNTTAYLNPDGSYNTRPPAEQPEGTIEVLSSFCESERINAMIPADASVISITGILNDYLSQLPLGTLDDFYNRNETTVYGGYGATIYKMREVAPNAVIILITPNVIANNNLSIKIIDYIQVIFDVGLEASCPVFDVFGKSGINRQQISKFTIDGVHPNTLGGNRIDGVVTEGFKTVYPII